MRQYLAFLGVAVVLLAALCAPGKCGGVHVEQRRIPLGNPGRLGAECQLPRQRRRRRI